MKHSLVALYRLQRRRFKIRRSKCAYMAVVIGTLTTFLEWTGYLGFRFSGQIRPKAFEDVWWHIFVSTGVSFCLMAFWPFRLGGQWGLYMDD